MTEEKMKATEAPSKPKAPIEPKFTPIELARKLHTVKLPIWAAPGEELFDMAYSAADSLYGWAKQAHHYGAESFKLTEAEFKDAVAAAVKFPTVQPSAVAIPQVSKDKFKNFKPRKAKG